MRLFTDPQVIRAEPGRSNPRQIKEELEREDLSCYQWSNGAGDKYAAHRRSYQKIIVVASGSITFFQPEQGLSINLTAGDRLELPAQSRHAANIGPEGVVCLEAHIQ